MKKQEEGWWLAHNADKDTPLDEELWESTSSTTPIAADDWSKSAGSAGQFDRVGDAYLMTVKALVDGGWNEENKWSPLAAATLARDAMLAKYQDAQNCRKWANEALAYRKNAHGQDAIDLEETARLWNQRASQILDSIGFTEELSSGDDDDIIDIQPDWI